MATVNLPFESLLTDIGLGQLKNQLDQLIANPADTAEMVFEHLKDQVDSPINLPVVISKPADQYIIEAAEDLIANNQEFFLHELESVLKQFRIKLNDAVTQVDEILMQGETQLQSLRDRVTDELSKIPYSIEIRDAGGTNEFFINQTGPIEAKIQGVEVNVISSSLAFTSSNLTALELSIEAFLPGIQNEDGSGPHQVTLSIEFGAGTFTGTAANVPAARLQGFQATIDELTLVIQNGEFQAGTQISGELVFDFLDDGQNGPGKIDFEVELLNNGDVRYQAQNSEGQELKKGSVSIFFEQIEITTHPAAAADVSINGWAELPGVEDSNTQEPAKTNFDFSYADPHFEFTGTNFTPIPLGFGTATFDTVFLRIHKDGNLVQSTWEGDLELPLFSNGQLGFNIQFKDAQTDRLKIEISGGQPIQHGGFVLDLQTYEMLFENGELQDVSGDGELTIPEITSGTPIQVELSYTKASSRLEISATNFGTPEIVGCQIDFAQIQFIFLNGAFSSSAINGHLKLPDVTDGAGILFDLEIANQGNDYTIQLTGSPQDSVLNFGPVQLEVSSFELEVVNSLVQSVNGAGSMQLPGLSQAFVFTFDVTINGPTTTYAIQINDIAAEIGGFNLSFTQINLSSQGGQQFSASAVGSLTLPVFEDGGALDFAISFDRDNNYQIAVNSGTQFVEFGDFKLNQVQIELNIQTGVIQDFTGSAGLQIPGFNSESAVSLEFIQIQDRYLIELNNPVDLDLFGGSLHMDSLDFEIRNGSFFSGLASGTFNLPDSTGGAGIQFELTIGNTGNDYTIELTGTPDQNTVEFGPVSLQFQSFSLTVQNGDLQSVTGAGALQLPGLSQPFNFNISVDTSDADPIYIIELTDITADLESFNLHFDQIRIESQESQQFSAAVNGDITLPVFDGSPIAFDVAIARTNNYTIAIDGTGQTANFGMFVLSNVAFSIQVDNGAVQNASGSAGFHIPELTQPDTPFTVDVNYSKNGNEDFSLNATNLPPADLAIFTLNIASLAFLIRNGSFESGDLTGSMTMPFFTNGGGLNFTFEVSNGGNSYTIEITSTGTLEGNGLEVKDIDLELVVNNGSMQSISGSSKFKLPGGDDFVDVSIAYDSPQNKLSFSASPLPSFSIGGLTFDFSEFGFSIQNGNLTDAVFAGELTIPACDAPNDKLGFNFEVANGNDYTIQANPGGGRTELKLGDVSLFIDEFDLRILNGDLESISAEAGLGFSGFEEEDGSGPAEIGIGFSYDKDDNEYGISLSQDQKIKIGGFAFTLKELELTFTPDSLEYPFSFEGELEIPGLKDDSDQPAKIEVTFNVPSAGNFSASIGSSAVFNIGSVKITVTEISVVKNGDEITVSLKGQLELEGFSGMGGESTTIAVDIEIDNQGAFHVLGEVTPSTNALKVLDIPSVVRIYLNKIGLSRTAANEWDFILGGLIQNQIVIPGMDNLLPSEINLKDLQFGNSFDIDLDIRWPSGLSVSFGGAQSEALIPVNGKFGNAVSLDAIKITYKDNGGAGVDLGVAFSGASITLGPVAASVEGLGIEATLSKATFSNGSPQGDSNFGIVNIDIRFKPPTGLGVSLDTPVFSGGGYLFFDKDKGEYAGAVELSFMNLFAVSAIGIINSKMPDGKPGTSVLFIVSVEFGTGIALGFGFFLSGLGGILGIHRTIQVERLRDGVRTGTIQNILFPKNIIANINKILTDIKEVFPVKRDQFVIGPMAAITWGVPTILRVDLGVVIEFASPTKFGILGVLRVILPDENAALIKIQVAFLGMIDFEKGMLSFDASLFDSKVLTFGLEGDMVLRIGWGEKPDFVLSVGGFHPRFTPPTHLGIPPMKRLTLKILSGNPRLTLTCYFAVTSNTVQFGAGIDFYFGVAGFKVVGEFGFDVLFQFSPFRFIADARARLAVKAGSATLLSLSLEFTLEGPTPWRAKGTAKFKILFFSVKVKFDVTWGDKKDTTLPDIEVLPLLLEAMEDIQNWRSVLSNPNSAGLRMKGLASEEELILTPNGSIEISQKVVPLEVEISKFGQFKPSDYTQFEVVSIQIGSSTDSNPSYITESFAPANFLDIKDNEKLALPSFQDQNSGVKLKSTDTLKTGAVLDRDVEYEQLIMDEENNLFAVNRLSALTGFSKQETTFFSRTGAVGRSALSAYQSRVVNSKKVELKKPGFAVVGTDDLKVVQGAQKLSYMEAVQIAKKSSSGTQSVQVVASDVLAL
ncbi:DUF6603 domain-containing protein [Algoriphagus zhangzhouensis]|uniref:DUF6603 domain-containing protein n=1 Tax=Algoriphagus zhangzhouensis TaxID=1073327 RepID=A0A1M7ZF49_9BACT|nr:DUF6603 domain-containing protein [Algoriphagus zhangzhouensis]TDY46210.1 hypothetical protein A8938_2821 [Algoriphagus zhangzhouensis]SHO63535.1 hypothetical protein SAMN04488108_2818 [Algoriphagus zhangzhouensis]